MKQRPHTGAAHCIGLIGVSLSCCHQCRETAMLFVRRDENGNITALYEQAKDMQTESLAVDHPDVMMVDTDDIL